MLIRVNVIGRPKTKEKLMLIFHVMCGLKILRLASVILGLGTKF